MQTSAELFVKVESQKAEFLTRLRGWPVERLHRSPAPGSWSGAQIAEHLMKTEREIEAEVRRQIAAGGHSIGLRDRLGVRMIDFVFRSPRKVKVPKSVTSVLPVDQVDFSAMLHEWERNRNQLRQTIEGAPERATHHGVFRHPVGGWMTLPQVLNFFSSHLVHHHFQLDAIERVG